MDLKMFTQTILPFKDKLFRFACRLLGDATEAEDVVQETLIKLWNAREKFDEIQNPEAWCIRVARNLAIDRLRSTQHKSTSALPDGKEWQDTSANPYQQTERSSVVELVKKLMNRLPPNQKMVMQLRDLEGMTYEEISKTLEISMEQVKVNLHRARKTIREQIIQNESYGLRHH
jgi:RNA polymerase sigma-70 factor (ECF subfamily)